MNPLVMDIVKLIALLGTVGIMAVCAGIYVLKSTATAKPLDVVPDAVRNAAPPKPRFVPEASSPEPQQAANSPVQALMAIQQCSAVLASLGVSPDEIAKMFDPIAPLLLKPKAGK